LELTKPDYAYFSTLKYFHNAHGPAANAFAQRLKPPKLDLDRERTIEVVFIYLISFDYLIGAERVEPRPPY